jgi:hypothetical protein
MERHLLSKTIPTTPRHEKRKRFINAYFYLGILMLALSPLAYFLQTVDPIPALPEKTTEKKSELYDEEAKTHSPVPSEKIAVHANGEKIMTEQEEVANRPLEDISAPDIKTALKEAFSSPTFIFITLGFSVCGFHIAFLSTHFPAYLVSSRVVFKNVIMTKVLNIHV